MREEDPEGFVLRIKGKKRPIVRTQLFAAGPFDHVHADGTEKLAGCGFPIYVIKDRATSGILFMDTRPNIRQALPVRLLFLECMESLNGAFKGGSVRGLRMTLNVRESVRHLGTSHRGQRL